MADKSSAEKYSNALEEIDKLNKVVELRDEEIKTLTEDKRVLRDLLSEKTKDVEDYQELMKDFQLGTGERDAIEALQDAREYFLQKFVIHQFGADTEKARNTKTFEDKQQELSERTDIFAILKDAVDLDPESYWRETCTEQKALSEKLQTELENLKQTTISLSDHRAAVEDLKNENSPNDDEIKELLVDATMDIQRGKQALTLARNQAICAYLYYSSMNDEVKQHHISTKTEEIKNNDDLRSLHKEADAFWDLAGLEQCGTKYKESLVLDNEDLRRKYLTYATLS